MATASPRPLPAVVYGICSGEIDPAAFQRISAGITTACANNVKAVHLMFQSSGGHIGEGIALYNLFRSLPFDLTIYNAGSVASMAVIAYLGAKHRKTSAHASFMIHRTQTTTVAANTQTIKSFAESAVLFDKNTEAILRKHIKMNGDKWSYFDHNNLWFSAQEAVDVGIADEIAEFSPPLGTELFYF